MIKEARQFDVAVVGGGPAGLTAAIILGRACRRVILFDDGKPRNYAARAVHGFPGLDGITPSRLREKARGDAQSYAVEIVDSKITLVERLDDRGTVPAALRFKIATDRSVVLARAVLFATGVVDEIPEIHGIRELYGICVHHCPYCDAWEHRGKHLVALANGSASVELALSLKPWSNNVSCCPNGGRLKSADRRLLGANRIAMRPEPIAEIARNDQGGANIQFENGANFACDAIFFGAGQRQHSQLPIRLGCEVNEDGLIRRDDKQRACVEGVFVAGDAAGDVQFAIVAAAQGAKAATAIHRFLQDQEIVRP
jgi:thioredoxin reductase